MPDNSQQRIQYLLQAWINKTYSEAEQAELWNWMFEANEDSDLQGFVLKEWKNFDPTNKDQYNYVDWNGMFAAIMDKVDRQAPVRKIFNWRRWAVAASILFVVCSLLFVVRSRKSNDGGRKMEIAKQDIPAPDRNRASITLADGRTIYLDSADNGQLVNQNEVIVSKIENGKIIYQSPIAHGPSTMVYNTLSNPRGSKVIDLILSDGSHVWLNSGSSITYPVAFVKNAGNVGNVRNVKMSGEAYFEVAHDSNSPFVVEANGVFTKVLGTHFNVNAYDDESEIKVTLLEGSVQVSRRSGDGSPKSVKITPGQQAVLTTHTSLFTTNSGVDLDDVMAWKNDLFIFNNSELPVILRQVSRWYDVGVTYKGAVPVVKLGGGLSRKVPLSKVIEMLKANGVRINQDGNSITVE